VGADLCGRSAPRAILAAHAPPAEPPVAGCGLTRTIRTHATARTVLPPTAPAAAAAKLASGE
jgi:hypothetical protein